MMRKYTLLRAAALVLTGGLAAGCASTGDLNSLRDDVQRALSQSGSAQNTANEALTTARRAEATASEAKAMAQATDERINRMFKRSMMK